MRTFGRFKSFFATLLCSNQCFLPIYSTDLYSCCWEWICN